MTLPHQLLHNNRTWAQAVQARDPVFFSRLSHGQQPDYLWIGCSDSRVPPNLLLHLPPGAVFVHRNVANIVDANDRSMLATLQFATQELRVSHVIVCGHYGCGGVHAAIHSQGEGPVNDWVAPIKGLYGTESQWLEAIGDSERMDRLCELNALRQTTNVCRILTETNAWAENQKLTVHGCMFDLHEGRLHDLGVEVTDSTDLAASYESALSRIRARSSTPPLREATVLRYKTPRA